MDKEIVAFIVKSMRESKKGYYDEDPIWISGYVSACEDMLERIEEINGDNSNGI